MDELSGFDKWFGTTKWRSGVRLDFESAPGTWVDISDFVVPGSIQLPPEHINFRCESFDPESILNQIEAQHMEVLQLRAAIRRIGYMLFNGEIDTHEALKQLEEVKREFGLD